MAALTFRNLLEDGDVPGLMAAWGELFPGMPQPSSFGEAEIAMHMARTASESVSFKLRAYSHRWLDERDLPSQLPDELKPRAERLYPVAACAVGISVNARSEWMRPAMIEVRGAMETAVLDAEADRRLADSDFVKARMNEARARTMKQLFGRFHSGAPNLTAG